MHSSASAVLGMRTPRQAQARGAHTPKRERPGQPQPHLAQTELPRLLRDDQHFPELQSTFQNLPRGRNDRRYGICDQNDKTNCARSLSRPKCREEQPPPSRARAISCDLADTPTPMRSAMKQRPSTSGCQEAPPVNEALAKVQREMEEKMKEMAALMRQSQAAGSADTETQMAMQLSQMLASLPAGSSPAEAKNADSSATLPYATNTAAEVEMRPRRNSKPRAGMEPQSSQSWEFPLSTQEKRTRVVMMGEAEINMQDEIIDTLEERVASLSLNH